MLVSIITIVKNGMPFVSETIQSVINQDYEFIEYIVIDSVSTDGTVEYVLSCKDKVTKFISEKDAGIADAFNKGLSLASGDYIMFLNADDQLNKPDVVTSMVNAIFSNNCPMLIYGDYETIDRESGDFLSFGYVEFSESKLIYGQVIPHPCLLTKKAYFDTYGTFDTDFKIAMDYEWLLRGVRKYKPVHISLIVTKIRNGGVSTQNRKAVISEIIKALRKNSYINSKFEYFGIQFYFFSRAFLKSLFLFLQLNKLNLFLKKLMWAKWKKN